MADSDIVINTIQTQGGVGSITITLDITDPNSPGGIPNLQLDATEIFYSATNDRNTSTLLATIMGNQFVHSGLARDATYYYWARPRNKAVGRGGQRFYGDWAPFSPIGGALGMEANNQFLLEENGYNIQPNGLIDQWGNVLGDSSGNWSIVFPIPFPSQVLDLHLTAFRYFDPGLPPADDFEGAQLPAWPQWLTRDTTGATGWTSTANIHQSDNTLPLRAAYKARIYWGAKGI